MHEQTVVQFLKNPGVVFDVRSPLEHAQGHIPGAFNLPLFSDSERAVVGTLYKHEGRERAIEEGLKIAGPKLKDLSHLAKTKAGSQKAKIHCFRGGMRSQSVAWLLQFIGMETETLPGGYKAYRQVVLHALHAKIDWQVLGGLTGSGKTKMLHCLKAEGKQILDLEALANHKGSSFGSLNQSLQPTQEQFENLIAAELFMMNLNEPIWIEDESRMIGRCKIPDPIYNGFKEATLFLLEKSKHDRIQKLIEEYGSFEKKQLIEAIVRLEKRLGKEKTKEAASAIESGDLQKTVEILLDYYDAAYLKSLSNRLIKHFQ